MKIFLTSYAGRVIDKIMPKLPKKPQGLEVLFITTAGNPYPEKPWQDEDRENLIKNGFSLTDYDLEGKTEDEVRRAVNKRDVIIVEGGNTFYLLKYARESGFDKVMKEQKDGGKVYIGASAGAYIATPSVESTTWKRNKDTYGVTDLTGLGLVPFMIFPHYTDEYKDLIEEKKKSTKYPIIVLTDVEMVDGEGEKG